VAAQPRAPAERRLPRSRYREALRGTEHGRRAAAAGEGVGARVRRRRSRDTAREPARDTVPAAGRLGTAWRWRSDAATRRRPARQRRPRRACSRPRGRRCTSGLAPRERGRSRRRVRWLR
jgi:hypothetical protein